MLETAIGLSLGLIIGAIAAWVFLDRRNRIAQSQLSTTVALAQQKQSDALAQLESEKSQTQLLRQNLAQAQQNLATMQAQYESSRQNLTEQRQLLEQAQQQLRQAFATVSEKALSQNSETFLQLARERFATISTQATGSLDQKKAEIDGMLKPMRELIEQYQIRLTDIEKSRVESYAMLREQLGSLSETQRTLNTQTSQLVTALSRPAVRGQWGEISLRRLVELAGLSNRCDFNLQQNIATEDGRLRPDMVVNLPGDRTVVVDCKVPLDAFLDAASAADQDMRRSHLMRHAQQIRSRAHDLSSKAYWNQFDRAPEFAIMFLPGEAFLYSAIEFDNSLIDDCLKQHIIIATPSTLIALLKTIEFGWRQEQITQNAEQIKELGVDLYNRINTVLTHLSKLGASLTGAVKSYNDTVGSVESRVIVTARKFGELGARGSDPIKEPQLIDTLPRTVTSTLLE